MVLPWYMVWGLRCWRVSRGAPAPPLAFRNPCSPVAQRVPPMLLFLLLRWYACHLGSWWEAGVFCCPGAVSGIDRPRPTEPGQWSGVHSVLPYLLPWQQNSCVGICTGLGKEHVFCPHPNGSMPESGFIPKHGGALLLPCPPSALSLYLWPIGRRVSSFFPTGRWLLLLPPS